MEITACRELEYPIRVSALPPSPSERRIFRPAQLNALAKDLLESNFSQIWLEGEVSNLSRPASGHLYFTLKDASAQVRCAMFRNRALYLSAPIKDGQMVLARARVTLYEARGDYQLSVESLEPAGQGALQLAFEQLKARLDAEGLFAASRKRPLPAFIRRLAILTSPRGAALHDVLTVLARRFPVLPVELWPVPVQGADAAPEITQQLQAAINSRRYDAILITRGGGSLEDLWPFNDETLQRLVAASPIPVISAIGHEIDFSLLDFTADLRAATPSAAAELLSPDQRELSLRLQRARMRLHGLIQSRLEQSAQRLDTANARLLSRHPSQRLSLGRQQLTVLQARLQNAMNHQFERRLTRLKHAGRQLNALSPLATLQRGYGILRDENQRLISSCRQAHAGQSVTALLADGSLFLTVKSHD
jgi:exodeoxyribonuclease VII large subunit